MTCGECGKSVRGAGESMAKLGLCISCTPGQPCTTCNEMARPVLNRLSDQYGEARECSWCSFEASEGGTHVSV